MTQTTFADKAIGKAILANSKPLKKYIQIIKSGHIEEREIISLRSFIHKHKEAKDLIFEAWSANEWSELTLSVEQNQKGYDFLINQWKTQSGKERKNNPFGYREQQILENFSHFTLSSLYDAGNAYRSYFLPVYSCYDKDGNRFEYYYNGKVNIIG